MTLPTTAPATLEWIGDVGGHLRLIDQTQLPVELAWLDCRDPQTVFTAIRRLQVRGAPAIGIAAAYGVCLGLQQATAGNEKDFFARLDHICEHLATSRPTAVNLFWALDA